MVSEVGSGVMAVLSQNFPIVSAVNLFCGRTLLNTASLSSAEQRI